MSEIENNFFKSAITENLLSEFIKFMDSIKEMDYVSVKDDLRDRISAFYGVSKVFMADNTTSGGLNNEGMQILVTNRAVQKAQTVYNNYVFQNSKLPSICFYIYFFDSCKFYFRAKYNPEALYFFSSCTYWGSSSWGFRFLHS